MKAKHKLSPIQITRHIIQLIAFLLFPGLFILTYSSAKNIVTSLISGDFSLSSNAAELAVVIAVIPITIIFGRFFCGFICSFGAMGDLMYCLSGLVIKKRPNIPQKADKILKLLKYIALIFLVAFVWIIGIKINESNNPWYVFGVYSNIKGFGSAEAILSIGGLLLIAIMIVSFFFERFFCRYLCPLGALFAVISRIRLFRFKRNGSKCVSCGLCDKKCSMGIEISTSESVSSGECISCMKCADVCLKDALTANLNPAVAGVCTAAAVTGLYYAGNIAAANISDPMEISADAVQSKENRGVYEDGVYSGTGQGFRGKIDVTVTVEDGFITDIEAISEKDDAAFWNKAKTATINSIILSQSAEVAAVSGATFSSNGIMEAVANALDVPFENPNGTERNTHGGKHDKGDRQR